MIRCISLGIWGILVWLALIVTVQTLEHVHQHSHQHLTPRQEGNPPLGSESHSEPNMASGSLNVFKQPLKQFSQQPMTGFFRDGYCRTGGVDPGNHAVAGVVTDEFLDFSASRGNDLRTVGLKGGCRWCLCTARWLEAYQAHRAGKVTNLGVPRVDLDATEDSALSMVDMNTFRQFAVQSGTGPAGSGASGSGSSGGAA
ncbi:hypothetical protein F4780DRAFT_752419 [Xylariomycetidae sp. FL0641]|nr:hypothetical protein F4780DRAFT_752419 [Xylariomycetidae sp. FL0641]